jgi:NAD+ synthase (glutamine-hydrolysing)
VGGQDELVFDGHSTILDHHGEVVRHGRQFEEDLFYVDLSLEKIRNERRADMGYQQRRSSWQNRTPVDVISIPAFENKTERPELKQPVQPDLSQSGETYQALVLGTRDYIQKNGFQKAVLGLSGGIDSALCAAIAVDALGSENVIGIAMPSAYSSDHSVNDAEALARNLQIEYQLLPIKKLVEAYRETLAPAFKDMPEGIAEENIQARIRGNLVMALSNKFNYLALTTGNKSEVSVGYCTLYGDMAGGFAIIKDVPKVQVYKLAEYRNSLSETPVIPLNTIEKPPSAELKPDQLDQDSLPPYDILDRILQAYVEQDLDEERITELGFPAEQVHEIIRLVDRSEYKRRQSAPGVKISQRSFGKDRRMPITNRYHVKQK